MKCDADIRIWDMSWDVDIWTKSMKYYADIRTLNMNWDEDIKILT